MAATVNERIRDATVARAIDTTHYSNWVVRRMIALLNRVDGDLFNQLLTALDTLDPQAFSVQRLDGLITSVRVLNAQLYQQLGRELTAELRGFVASQVEWDASLFEHVLPPQLHVTAVSADMVYAAALSRPFQGRLLSEWVDGIEADRMTRIRDSLRMGYVEGKTVPQMVREIRGSRAKGYEDGIIEIDRRNAEAVVRTAISHTAGVARDNFHEANADLIKAEAWHATLDGRTSQMCRVRDGKQYTPVTHKPIGHTFPWLGGPGRLHWQCRSTSAPVLKNWEELGGAPGMPEFTQAQRASMDGAVPADMTYAEWLKKQSAARQDEVLGPTRGLLLRQGGLTVEQFSNDKGKLLTLDELRQRQARAFEKAGV